jgi:regulator of protease activity HflC (stomatin/prohibitin superfamily)
MQLIGSGLGLAVFFAIFLVFKWINILNEYERGVIFRLGRVLKEPPRGRVSSSFSGRSTGWSK